MTDKISFSKRFTSFFIDILIILVLTIAIGFPIGTKIIGDSTPKKNIEIAKPETEKIIPDALPDQIETKTPSENPFLATVVNSIDKIRYGFAFGLGLMGFLYGLIEAYGAASPGKLIINLKLIKEDKTKLTSSILFLRFLLKNLPFIFFIIAGITFIPAFERAATMAALILFIGMFRAMTDEGKTLLDLVCKTRLIKNIESDFKD